MKDKKEFRFVYGPVPSRRLGRSLGIDPLPFKTCNYNCIYCQLGHTRTMTNERSEFFPLNEIMDEVKRAITLKSQNIDFITIVGSGEPLLYSRLGELIRSIRDITDKPLALITNGSLLYRDDVRDEVLDVDVIIPSLDAANQELFKRINRPHKDLRIDRIIEGMAEFKRRFKGQMWIEVMLLDGLNDTERALFELRDAIELIRPQKVQINLPIRPPAEEWVKPASSEGVMRAKAILGRAVELIGPQIGDFDLTGVSDITDAIVEIIKRHPMNEKELIKTLKKFAPMDVRNALEKLEREGRARKIEYSGMTFWTYVKSRYGRKSR